MNIIDIQDQLKNFSENQLIKEMQAPSGSAPQFLVLSEIQRRKRVRDDFSKRQAAQEPTVAEEAVAAAGVPMQGIAGMSEAMAPQSAVSEGIGTIMPQTMRQTAPAPTPAPEEMAMGMAGGGLLDSLFKGRDSLAEASKRPEIRITKDGRKAMYKPGTNIFLGFVNEDKEMAEGGPLSIRTRSGNMTDQQYAIFEAERKAKEGMGLEDSMNAAMSGLDGDIAARKRFNEMAKILASGGHNDYSDQEKIDFASEYKKLKQDNNFASGGVLRAQQGMYMPEDPILRALMMQESGGDPMATGSVGEIGAFQIRPETALMPGYGIKSLFPEISAQIGAAKKYKTASEAYKANKELIDSALRDTKKAEAFAGDYLGKAEDRLGSLESALLAYNRGISGAGKVEDPTQDPYYKGVMGFMDDDNASPTMTADSGLEAVLADRGMTAGDLFQQDVDPGLMSATADTSALVRPGGPKILGETPFTGGPNNTIGDSTDGTIGLPLPVPGLLGKKGTDEPLTQGEAGIVPKDHPDANKPAVITPDPSTGAPVFIGDPGVENVKPEDVAKRVEDFKKETGQTDDSEAATQSASGSPNITINNKSDTYAATDLVEEIKALQAKMEKNRESDKWLALAQAGMALMSSKEPTLLGAAGEAGIAGLTAMREANERYEEGVVDLINARAKITGKDKMGLTGSNVVSRINQLTESIAGGMLTAGEKAAAENEIISLKRLVGIPLFAA